MKKINKKTRKSEKSLTKKEKALLRTSKSFSNTPLGCYVHVYTGEGSGKTTSALGVALRSTGHSRKVIVVQFLKGRGSEIGEYNAQKYLKNYRVYQFGRAGFISNDRINPADVKLAKKGLLFARKIVQDRTTKLLILDEITLALYYKLLTLKQVLDFLDFAKKTAKKRELDIYLTGRNCPPALVSYADFATEIKTLKRPDCFQSRKGIEF